jgi:hypothetical protein
MVINQSKHRQQVCSLWAQQTLGVLLLQAVQETQALDKSLQHAVSTPAIGAILGPL